MEERWLAAPDMGTGATTRVWGLLLLLVFGEGLPWVTAQNALCISEDPEGAGTVLAAAGSFYLEDDGPVEI